MKIQFHSAVLMAVLFCSSSVWAQSDFFFSFEQGGQNTDQSRAFNVGESGSLWVYWSTNGPADSDLDVGAIIDVFTDGGVIEFTAAETFDYDILVADTPSGITRLAGEGFGAAGSVAPELIEDLAGFTVTGGGILEENNGSGIFLDTGYNASNDAFEWGRIDFNVIGEGVVGVSGRARDGLIVNNGKAIDATFSTVTILTPVPEPSTAAILSLGLAGLAIRRRD